jgi:hypothetical protein
MEKFLILTLERRFPIFPSPARESLVSFISAGDWKIGNLFSSVLLYASQVVY